MKDGRRLCLSAGAITILAAATARAPDPRPSGLAPSRAAAETTGTIVLTLRSEASTAPCDTFWERGSAPDARHAWVDLHSTSDGGRTWRVVTFSRDVDAAMHLHGVLDPSDDSLAAIHSWFITAMRGWLVVLRREETPAWQTDDGAKTWRSLPDWHLSKMRFADTRHGMALVRTRKGALETMLTADAGDTWSRCGATYRHSYFDSLFLLDARRGWAWVSAPTRCWKAPSAGGDCAGPTRHGVMQTEDGGCHWHGEWNDRRSIAERGELYFLDERDGWLAGGHKPGLYHTTDGGLSWKPLPLPANKMMVKSVYFRDADRGWLITNREELFETNDAGRSWRGLAMTEVAERLDQLMSSWDRWPVGRLYGMLSRGGCFTHEQLERRRQP